MLPSSVTETENVVPSASASGGNSKLSVEVATASVDVAYSYKVLAHIVDIGAAMREMARVVRPGGWVLAEFYNARSIRRLVKALKPATAVSTATNDEAVYTRYDSLPQIRSYLPSDVQIQTVHGIRVVTPFSQAHRWPVIGPALRMVERHAAVLPGIRRFGGFLLVVARKDG